MKILIFLFVSIVLALSAFNQTMASNEKYFLSSAESTPNSMLDRIEQELLHQQVRSEAISELTDLINHDPRNYRAHLLMGNYCDDLGLPQQAVVQYQLAFKYGPNQPQACLDLIKSLIKTGQTNAASNLLKQAIERFPDNPQVLLWAGNSLFAQGKYGEAESVYQQAMQQDTNPVMGLPTALARLQIQKAHYAAAVQLASRDLAMDKNFVPANEVMGVALMKVGLLERAMPYLKIAFLNDQNSYAIAFDYAQSLIWCGMYSDAVMPMLCSLAAAHGEQESGVVCKAINRLVVYLSRKNVVQSAQEIRRFPRADNNAAVHSQLAKMCLNKGLIDLAVSESFLAVRLAPQAAEANYEIALLLESYQHNNLLALQYLRRAHVLAPNNSEINQHLMRMEDRLTSSQTDWSMQFKNWLFSSHQKRYQ